MSHDIEASYAAAEIAASFLASPANCFANPPGRSRLSVYATREGRNQWPHADGVIELAVTDSAATRDYSVAVEFKRPNEGLHGVLTALGQAHAYLRKGYSGAVIVVPEKYSGLPDSGSYLKEVIELTSRSEAIGVYSYRQPDMSKALPFEGCLRNCKKFKIDIVPRISAQLPLVRTETQWAHVREGSTDPDALLRYLQAVKLLGGGELDLHQPRIPALLQRAIERQRPGSDPEKYLSNCPGDSLPDRAWRHFWFKYVLHDDAIKGWNGSAGNYVVNEASSLIERSDGGGKKRFFFGRSDSIKNKLVKQLNSRNPISLNEAADELVQNYFSRAHSYREDIDSGCEHLGFIDSDGRLTDDGYKFVDACERYGKPNEGLPKALFLKAVLCEGGLGAFLHYVYRLSEERFRANPLTFAARKGLKFNFNQDSYLKWLETEMANRLHVIRKVRLRGGVQRKPFQAELALLRNLGVVGDFRLGIGLTINWPEFQDALNHGAII